MAHPMKMANNNYWKC